MTFFDTAYQGSPAWDIGRPQAVVVRLEEEGCIVGDVSDVGCGTGEHALYLAGRGHTVMGIDLAPAAIERASAKAAARGLGPEFMVWDALRVGELGRTFDTALDIGLFHTLGNDQRLRYARALGAALRPGGRLVLLCWSERNEWGTGPRRVSQREIRRTFVDGWVVELTEGEDYETKLGFDVHGWLASIKRAGT